MLPCFKQTLVYELISEELGSHEPMVFNRFIYFKQLLGAPIFKSWVGAALTPWELCFWGPHKHGGQVWILRKMEPTPPVL